MKRCAVLLLILAPSLSCAQTSGRELLSACVAAVAMLDNRVEYNATSSNLIAQCLSYVTGFSNGIEAAQIIHPDRKIICMPQKVTVEQTIRVVEKFLRERPESLHQPSTVIAAAALINAFPCK